MLHCFSEKDCLWTALAAETRPIVLYGTGNGADKILDICQNRGIAVSGVFASSGFVRQRSFRGMPVESLEAIEERLCADFVVLLAFGTTLSTVAENIRGVAKRHTLYIPEVPLYGGELFDFEYYTAHLNELVLAESLFSDGRSKKLLYDMVAFRLTGKPEYLAEVQKPYDSYCELLPRCDFIIDCGAYTGDSTGELISALSPKSALAIESDPKTFKKLSAYAENEKRCAVTPINAAVGAQCGASEFSLSGNRGSAAEGLSRRSRESEVGVISLDSLSLSRVDLIKLDVEGWEAAALDGAEKIIARFAPSLAVSVYHRTEDIFALTRRVHELLPQHRLYLRRAPCIPAWDIVLFAVR